MSSLEPFLIPLEGQAEVMRSILEPALDGMGLELVQMFLVRATHRDQLRLFIDKKEGGIAMADLEKMNRTLGDLLDVEDQARGLFKKPYDLEVGSPGLDRPLTKRSHFAKALGKQARVKTRGAIETPAGPSRAFKDAITAADADSVTIGTARIPFHEITSAHVVFEIEEKVRPGKGGKSAKSQKNQKTEKRESK